MTTPATFDFGPRRRPRRMSLTPMIDVVFLLLIFFMLVSRFGHDLALPIEGGTASAAWQGPPRLIDIGPDTLRLNGTEIAAGNLAQALDALLPEGGGPVVLRPRDQADLQRLVDVMDLLRQAGLSYLILAE